MLKPQDIRALCEKYAPEYKFDPLLIMAIVEQESSYDESEVRLENGFYRKYTRPLQYSTTTEILLAASYGLMQVMGESLKELGFFSSWFEKQTTEAKAFLGDPLCEVAVPKAINAYMVHPEWQIEWGCQWLARKRSIAQGDTWKMLLYWNGSPDYPHRVLEIQKKLSGK